MRRRKRLTFSRALALLILGIGLGATLFALMRLRSPALQEEVVRALGAFLETEAEIGSVSLGLHTGVEIADLKIPYPPGEAGAEAEPYALEVKRVVLKVDHRELLAGNVRIRRVDLEGLTLRLKAGEALESTPSMPGVFASAASAEPFELPDDLPEINIVGESKVEILDAAPLGRGSKVTFVVKRATAAQFGLVYEASGEFSAELADRVEVVLRYERPERRVLVNVRAKRLHWSRQDLYTLEEWVREALPPVELGGEADVDVDAVIGLPLDVRTITVTAKLRKLAGVFGNVHTSDRVGLPFGVRDGAGTLVYRDKVVRLRPFAAVYVSPSGAHGSLDAELDLDLRRPDRHLDLALRGRAMEGSTEDLRHLLPPDIVESIVEKFLPAGTFDFDLTVTQRPGTEEKVVASLRTRDGRFDYAGQLDELTGKRFGFRYPLERCEGRFRVETHIATPRGFAEVFEIDGLKGFNPVSRPQPGGPEDVAVDVNGRAVIYGQPADEEPEDLDISILVKDLPIDKKLAQAFASTPGGMPYRNFDLSGWARRVAIRIERDAFREPEPRTTYDVTLDDCSIAYEGFRFPIRGVRGHIVSRDLPPDGSGRRWRLLRFENLTGSAPSGGEFFAHGEVRQEELGTELMDLRIRADRVRIGDDLERALVGSSAAGTAAIDIWRSLRPYGYISADVTIAGPRQVGVVVDLRELGFRGYEGVDCPISDLRGSLSYGNGRISLDDVSGRIFDAPFRVSGQFHDDGYFVVSGQADGLVLEEAVRRILEGIAPTAATAITDLQLDESSKLDVVVTCTRQTRDSPVALTFTLDRLDVRSRVLDFDLSIRGGPVNVELDGIHANNVQLRARDAELRLREVSVPYDRKLPARGSVDARNLEPSGHLERLFGPGIREALGDNTRIDSPGLEVEYLRVERKLTLTGGIDLRRHAMIPPVALEPTGGLGFSPVTLTLPPPEGGPLRFEGIVDLRRLNLNVPVPVRDLFGDLLVAEGFLTPEFRLNGALRNASVVLFDRTLTDMSVNVEYRPDYLLLGNFDGKAYGGHFLGNAEIYLVEPHAFNVRFQAQEVQLGEMLKEDLPRSDPMTGTIEARIELESPSGEVQDMRGRGQVRVKEGSLFRVPGLRPILGVLSRVTALEGEPRFERAEADFNFEGEEIRLHHCRLSTDLNDVDAEGTISIYGDLDLVVEPKVSRLLDLPRIVNIPVLSTIRDLWHRIAYEIRLEGTLDSPAIRLRGLPFMRGEVRHFVQSPHAGRAERVRPRLLP